MPESSPGLDAAHLARGAVGLGGDLGHGGLLTREQDGLGLALVRLVGVGVARREERGEEQHHPDERDAGPAHALHARHRSRSDTGCHCPGRDSAIPSRAGRSIGSRCIDFPLSRSSEICVVALRGRAAEPPGLTGLCGLSECPVWSPVVVWRMAATGPAPETGGGTEEVPKAGPGGGPPRPRDGAGGVAHWPPRRREIGWSERAAAAMRRRPISGEPGQSHAGHQHDGQRPRPVLAGVHRGHVGDRRGGYHRRRDVRCHRGGGGHARRGRGRSRGVHVRPGRARAG